MNHNIQCSEMWSVSVVVGAEFGSLLGEQKGVVMLVGEGADWIKERECRKLE